MQNLYSKRWNNVMFKYNDKTIFFKRLQQLSCILNDKTTWLCEYKVMKSVPKRYYMKFDMSYCFYTKISSKRTFLLHTGYKSIVDKRCIFYGNLLQRKMEKPCYQSVLNREFSVEKEYWLNIPCNKVQNIYAKRVCEFNYKPINNLLCCNLSLNRCRIRPTKTQ